MHPHKQSPHSSIASFVRACLDRNGLTCARKGRLMREQLALLLGRLLQLRLVMVHRCGLLLLKLLMMERQHMRVQKGMIKYAVDRVLHLPTDVLLEVVTRDRIERDVTHLQIVNGLLVMMKVVLLLLLLLIVERRRSCHADTRRWQVQRYGASVFLRAGSIDSAHGAIDHRRHSSASVVRVLMVLMHGNRIQP
uniref:Uncharacterized protein n=1 Tax=Anopheles atroparvus TaxID=41427 RepID=A0A182JHS6_ANOAO